jgi:DNA-binding CsgD family transcriptional regulator
VAREESARGAALVGRREELEVLDRLVADVAAGNGRVLVVRGEAGTGKTALLHELAARVPGWRVVSAAAGESEADLAHGGLRRLCTPLADRLGALPAPQRNALARVLGLDPGPAPDPFPVALAALSLVTEAARHQPLACLVDDAQWLDRASARVLAFVARRLATERVALVCAARTGGDDPVLPGMPVLTVRGLPPADARDLLLRDLHVPLDPAVADRVVAESHGNPRALLEVARTGTVLALAGGFGLPGTGPPTGGTGQEDAERLGPLPADTRLLVLAAAADPVGDPGILHRAAAALGIDPAAVGPAVDAGLLRVGGRVEFASLPARSAVYRAATAADRRRVHAAVAEATGAGTDPDRRAWHRARAVAGPDEEVAAELERSAGRARLRGGLAADAAFRTRATELTPGPARRVRRALDAAAVATRAGALGTARALLDVVRAGPVEEVQHARLDLARAQLALASGRGDEAVPLLLSAARRLRPHEPDLARAASLDALCAARVDDGALPADLTGATGSALRPDGGRTVEDLLLAAFAAPTGDPAAAVPTGRQALAALRGDTAPTADGARRLWHGTVLALQLWDDGAAYALADEHLRTVRGTGALGELPLALGTAVPVLVLCGELPAAAALVEEGRSVGVTGPACGALLLDAWRGRALDPTVGGTGAAVRAHAQAVLSNGLGRHEEALAAARVACAGLPEPVVHGWALAELVEAAARTGRADLAADALRQLTARTRACGTDWALGVAARARALLGEGGAAEDAFRQALEHLGRARVRVELARAHLLFGEWLQRAGRRTEARDQLDAARSLSAAMGLEALEERSRRGLRATGADAGTRGGEASDDLTAQEALIAGLARDGLSNPEIGVRLFLSARTVEWHLRKVFTKLGIRTRRDLRRALADREEREGDRRP